MWRFLGLEKVWGLLGTSPQLRNRSIPSGFRLSEASGCLSFPPLWETSGQSLVRVRLRPSRGRLLGAAKTQHTVGASRTRSLRLP